MSKSIKQETQGILRDLPRTGLGDKIDHVVGGFGVYTVTYFIAQKLIPEHAGLVGLSTSRPLKSYKKQ